jgi:hypothetical protein
MLVRSLNKECAVEYLAACGAAPITIIERRRTTGIIAGPLVDRCAE